MYIVSIAWLYVALMMSVAEASNSNGTLLGASVTFVLYGLLPIGILHYIMGTPGRKRRLRMKEAKEREIYLAAQSQADKSASSPPDAGGHAPAHPIAPVRKEP
ncbi:MAG: hypothetical protein ORN29_00205 [Rhodoferax sp.]|nr:hypothetical protein [Rhodoferax sp.]